MGWEWGNFGDYVSADEKRRRSGEEARKLEKKGRQLAPVHLAGRAIANTFWGKAWGRNLESYSDYASRLPRGRSYVRQGAVIDLQVQRGVIKATVSGTHLYEIEIKIDTLGKEAWARLKKECAGKVGSLMDLLQGKLSAPVMEIVTRHETGLFPRPKEIHLDCSCPDWADMCKHVAAVLYGVGARLDESPELLFVLRGVDHLELIASATQSLHADLAAPATGGSATLDESSLAEVFGIDIATSAVPVRATKPKQPGAPAPTIRRTTATTPAGRKKVPASLPAKKTSRPKRVAAKKKPRQAARKTMKSEAASASAPTKGANRPRASK